MLYSRAFLVSGRNSVVECYLAKVDVDGSNPFARSILLWRHSQVAKAAVCKTVIHQFESDCRLQYHSGVCFLKKGLLFYSHLKKIKSTDLSETITEGEIFLKKEAALLW